MSLAGRILILLVITLLAALLTACDAGTFSHPNSARFSSKPLIAANNQMNNSTKPSVLIADQVFDGKSVVVSRVISRGPGWIVIHNQQNGKVGPVIGQTQVNNGLNLDVAIQVDPAQTTPVLYAVLHTDRGIVGQFEFPGPDNPVYNNGVMLAGQFTISTQRAQAVNQNQKAAGGMATANGQTLVVSTATNLPPTVIPTAAPPLSSTPAPQVTKPALAAKPSATAVADMPTIIAGDQAIENKTVTVSEVLVYQDAWLVIRRLNGDGNMGAIAGYVHIPKGLNENVAVSVDTTITSDILFAQVLEDNGVPGKLEFPTPDIPLQVNGVLVAKTFKVIRFSDGGTIMGVYPDPVNGAHLVVGHAQSVYISSNDAPGQSNCTGDCLKLWQPVIKVGNVVYSAGVQKDKLGFFQMPNGSVWLTYNGYPLYTYANDIKPGDANGNGGNWSLVVP